MAEMIALINGKINGIVWGIPMMILIIGTGLYFTIRTGFLQFSKFGYAMKNTIGKCFKKVEAKAGAVTPVQALTTALAATVGTGNIAGVCGAIAAGGPGAIFWMWLSALVGMCTKFSEVTLAIRYRERNDKGDWVGGPMAKVIEKIQRPTLVLAHNKTLASQLCEEFRAFFPDNAVEYFVSYYDYYQPEAYIPHTDTYIAKDASTNDEIDRLRLSATCALLERRDVIVVSSVSCIYGLGEPEDFAKLMISVRVGMAQQPCPACKGKRLRKEALAVTVGGLSIYDFTRMSVLDELNWVNRLTLTEQQMLIADRILKEIRSRLGFLQSVGLGYLTLSRSAGTLSGGESQRIRLATQIGSSLMGVLYILDEPSIGLHQRDNDKLLSTLKHLRDLGNTLLVVEHDEDTMMIFARVVFPPPLGPVKTTRR